MLGGIAVCIVIPFENAFSPILALIMLLNVFYAPVTSFVDTATMFMLGDNKAHYGRIRVGGTIGFGIASPLAGLLLQSRGLRFGWWISAGLSVVAFLVSQKFIYGERQAETLSSGKVVLLLKNPRWILFLILAVTGGAALAAVNNYLYPFMKELGASELTMGLAMLVGTISEIPVLFFGSHLITRLKLNGLFFLAMAVTGLRLILFAASRRPVFILAVQLLNGLTFSIMWMAGVSYADEQAPKGLKTTTQGLFNAAVMGIGTAVGGFLGGPLLDSLGGRNLYLIFGTAVLIMVAGVALIQNQLPPVEGIYSIEDQL